MVGIRVVPELMKFLKKPDTQKLHFETTFIKLTTFMYIYLICLSTIFIISILTGFIRLIMHIEFQPFTTQKVYFWLINLLLMPIFEESAFRLPLVYSKVNISISILLLTYAFLSYVLHGSLLNSENIIQRVGISVFIAILVFFVLGFVSNKLSLATFWIKNMKGIFYIYLFIFSLRHIDSYILTPLCLTFIPILLLPQIISGIFLSFVRLRFGFHFSIIFHVLINVIAITPQILILYAN